MFIFSPSNNVKTLSKETDIPDQKNHGQKIANKSFDFKIDQSIFEGLSKDLLPYRIISKTVFKITDNIYNLLSVNALYNLENGILTIKANQGTLNNELKLINLENDVRINYDNVEISSDIIEFNMNNKNAKSDSKVHVKYKNSDIEADKFNTESTEIINLEGNVESRFKLSDFE
jgi:LPS export ABC transporter protein LptC